MSEGPKGLRRHPENKWNSRWLEDSKTKLQAQVSGEKIDDWPEPCHDCGANWKRTPAGRWFINHFPHTGPKMAVPTYRMTRDDPREAA